MKKSMKKNLCFFGAVCILAAIAPAGCRSQSQSRNGGHSVSSPIPPYPEALIEMAAVPGGGFYMGSPETDMDAYPDERPLRQVTLSAFYMGKYEVTQGQWYAVMGDKPSQFTANPEDSGDDGWKNLPVDSISWYDALVFCNKLSMREGLEPAYSINGRTDPAEWGAVPAGADGTWDAVKLLAASNGYRIPTEAQWEYAAKGGNGSPGGYAYAGSNIADHVGWHAENSGGKTHQAGKKAANGLELYDMSGNVWEWCWDWYGNYGGEAHTDPLGASPGTDRVFRGGGWFYSEQYLRSSVRASGAPQSRGGNLGLRIVRPSF